MGIICGYLPNTNELLFVKSYHSCDKEDIFTKSSNSMSEIGRGGILFTFDKKEYPNYKDWNDDEISKRCAIWTIKSLINLNNITQDDIFAVE